MEYDVITLGETMLRLAPPMHQRLEQATQFDIEVAGSESNMAVGLARLGLNVAWISRLPANGLGRLVSSRIGMYGVDVSHIIWSEDHRIGLYFLELASPPRPISLIYDRQNSAASNFDPVELPTELFQAENARLLHLSGITLAIGEGPAAAARRALDMAKDAGWKVSFDLNYRAKLWSPARAREECRLFLSRADIIFTPLRDAYHVLGVPDGLAAPQVAEHLAGEYPDKVIIVTLGSEGAIGIDSAGNVVSQAAFPTDERIGRIGAGDAFAAGVIYGYLTFGDLAHMLRWGTAMASLKHTIPGDLALIEKGEVEQLLNQKIDGQISR